MSNLRNLPPGEVATAFISASSSCSRSLSFPLGTGADDEGGSFPGSWTELVQDGWCPKVAQDEATPCCCGLLLKTESDERSSRWGALCDAKVGTSTSSSSSQISTLFLKKRFSLLSRFWPVSMGREGVENEIGLSTVSSWEASPPPPPPLIPPSSSVAALPAFVWEEDESKGVLSVLSLCWSTLPSHSGSSSFCPSGFSEESSVPVGSPGSVAMGNGLSHPC